MNDEPTIHSIIETLRDCAPFCVAYCGLIAHSADHGFRREMVYQNVQSQCGERAWRWISRDSADEIVAYFDEYCDAVEEEEELPEYVTTDEIDDIILTLENESAFYKQYTGLLARKQAVEIRQSFIYGWIHKCYGNPTRQRVNSAQCDYMRKYFDARYGEIIDYDTKIRGVFTSTIIMDDPHTKEDLTVADIERLRQYVTEQYQQPPSAIEEPSMITKYIETKTFLKGRDVKQLTNQELYAEISTKEAEIEALQKIKNKPARLLKQIEDAQADITALVALIDGLDAPAAAPAAA